METLNTQQNFINQDWDLKQISSMSLEEREELNRIIDLASYMTFCKKMNELSSEEIVEADCANMRKCLYAAYEYGGMEGKDLFLHNIIFLLNNVSEGITIGYLEDKLYEAYKGLKGLKIHL